MSLINDFMQLLSSNIDVFTKWAEDQHNIPRDVVITKWNDLTGMNLVEQDNNELVYTHEEEQEICVQRPGIKPHLCQHIFKIGARKGEQCSKKPKGNAIKCSSHRQSKSGDEKEPKKNSKKEPKKNSKKEPKKKEPKEKEKNRKNSTSSDSD
jgi:hypothetical protein